MFASFSCPGLPMDTVSHSFILEPIQKPMATIVASITNDLFMLQSRGSMEQKNKPQIQSVWKILVEIVFHGKCLCRYELFCHSIVIYYLCGFTRESFA